MTYEAGPQIPVFTVADRYRKARVDAGLSQEELADEIGVSPRTISRYESGVIHRPREIVIRQWALRCNVPYDWLAEPFQETGRERWAARDSNPESAESMPALAAA